MRHHLGRQFNAKRLAFAVLHNRHLPARNVEVSCTTTDIDHGTFRRLAVRLIAIRYQRSGPFHNDGGNLDSHAFETLAAIEIKEIRAIKGRFDRIPQG